MKSRREGISNRTLTISEPSISFSLERLSLILSGWARHFSRSSMSPAERQRERKQRVKRGQKSKRQQQTREILFFNCLQRNATFPQDTKCRRTFQLRPPPPKKSSSAVKRAMTFFKGGEKGKKNKKKEIKSHFPLRQVPQTLCVNKT